MTKQRAFHTLEIGGQSRTLHFSMNFWSAFCEEMGIKLEQMGDVFQGGLDLKTIRAVFYCGILANDLEQKHPVDYNIYTVGEWLEDINAEQIAEVFTALAESKILGNQLNMGIDRTAKPKKAGK